MEKTAPQRARTAETVAMIVTAVTWFADGIVSIARPRWAELVPSLLVSVAATIVISRPRANGSTQDAVIHAALVFALVPCVALSLLVLMDSWWAERLISDGVWLHSSQAGCALVALAFMAGGFIAGIARLFAGQSIDTARWLPRIQSLARALMPFALVLVIAGAARRATHVSPDAMRAMPYGPIPTLSGSPPEAVILRNERDQELVVHTTDPPLHHRQISLRDRRSSRVEDTLVLATEGSELQYDARIGCVRVVSWRTNAETFCIDDLTRRASPWTQRRSLAPTLSWIAMALISLGFLRFATRPRGLDRWRRATVNDDHSVTIDGARFDCAKGVTIPRDTKELWVLTDEGALGTGAYREHCARSVVDVCVDPFALASATALWALASALLFLTPLAFALCSGMITGR